MTQESDKVREALRDLRKFISERQHFDGAECYESDGQDVQDPDHCEKCELQRIEAALSLPDQCAFELTAKDYDLVMAETHLMVPKAMKCHKCGAPEPWKTPRHGELAQLVEQIAALPDREQSQANDAVPTQAFSADVKTIVAPWMPGATKVTFQEWCAAMDRTFGRKDLSLPMNQSEAKIRLDEAKWWADHEINSCVSTYTGYITPCHYCARIAELEAACQSAPPSPDMAGPRETAQPASQTETLREALEKMLGWALYGADCDGWYFSEDRAPGFNADVEAARAALRSAAPADGKPAR